MILKRPIEIQRYKFDELTKVHNKTLLFKDRLFFICNMKTRTHTYTVNRCLGLWTQTIEVIHITEITMWGWNSEKKYWGTVDENGINFAIQIYNFIALREAFKNIKEALDRVNYNIVRRPETVLEPDQTHNYD